MYKVYNGIIKNYIKFIFMLYKFQKLNKKMEYDKKRHHNKNFYI